MKKLNWKRFYIKKYPANFFRQTFWLLTPIIAIGGLYYPWLGLIMPIMMVFLLFSSFFRGRHWCGNICPRGSFFDYIFKPISRYQKIPSFFKSVFFRISFLIFFMTIFTLRTKKIFSIYQGWEAWEKWGYVFATLCLFTSLAGILLGFLFNPRTWCSFCPMGTLEKYLYSLGNFFRAKITILSDKISIKDKLITLDAQNCLKCDLCSRVCPIQISPFTEARNDFDQLKNNDCLKCGYCVDNCPVRALSFQHPGKVKTLREISSDKKKK